MTATAHSCRHRVGLLVACLILTTCIIDLPSADDGPYRCHTDADCVTGYHCQSGFCSSVGAGATDPQVMRGDDLGPGDPNNGDADCLPECGSRRCGIEPVCGATCGDCANQGGGSCSPEGQCVPCMPELGCEDGNPCTYDDRCLPNGVCSGHTLICDSASTACGRKQSCNGTSTCTEFFPDAGTTCNDLNPCSYNDRCNGNGGCEGTPATCLSDPGPCGVVRSCDGSANCVESYPSTSVTCDDGQLCTYEDHCDGRGTCTGTALSCTSDPEVCGAQRSCNGTHSCQVHYPNTDTLCDDNDLCTYEDACQGDGSCAGMKVACVGLGTQCGPQPVCDGTSLCSYTTPESDVACDDGNPCTVDDYCDGFGSCVSYIYHYCPSDGCYSYTCAPETGECVRDFYIGSCEANQPIGICGSCACGASTDCCLVSICTATCTEPPYCGSPYTLCVPPGTLGC